MIHFIDVQLDCKVPENCYSYHLSEYKGEFTLEWSTCPYEGNKSRILNTCDFLKVQDIAKYCVPVSYRDGYIEIDDGEPDEEDEENYDTCQVQERL